MVLVDTCSYVAKVQIGQLLTARQTARDHYIAQLQSDSADDARAFGEVSNAQRPDPSSASAIQTSDSRRALAAAMHATHIDKAVPAPCVGSDSFVQTSNQRQSDVIATPTRAIPNCKQVNLGTARTNRRATQLFVGIENNTSLELLQDFNQIGKLAMSNQEKLVCART